MPGPSKTADTLVPPPGGRGPVAGLRGIGDVAQGQPVDDLPPLIEPEFEPVLDAKGGHRQIRRQLLAPDEPGREAPTTEMPARDGPQDVPTLVEPVAEPVAELAAGLATEPVIEPAVQPVTEPVAEAAAEPVTEPAAEPIAETVAEPVVQRLETPAVPSPSWIATKKWLTLARARWPTDGRTQLMVVAAGVVALALIAAVAAGIGPFAQPHHYPASAAPNDPAQRLAYFQRGAEAGDPQAELEVAIIYAKGLGVAQDYATSATWFRAAAEHGLARAQYDLGVLYERGRGVKVDFTEAANWYQKAAQAGYRLAQYNLAVCYTKGQGIRQDPAEAAIWYRRAAVQGVVQAMINLGTIYTRGEGVAVSLVDAYAWYVAAGRRDSSEAAQHAQELFNSLMPPDQIRAEALASDVNASIHDAAPERGEAVTGSPNAQPAAATR